MSENTLLIDFLNTFYRSIGTPLFYCREGKISFCAAEDPVIIGLAEKRLSDLTGPDEEAGYYVGDENLFWGMVRLPETSDYILMGPASSVSVTGQMAEEIIRVLDLKGGRERLLRSLGQLTCYPVERLFHYLGLLYFFIYRKKLPVDQLFRISEEVRSTPIRQLHSDATYRGREIDRSEESYSYEVNYLQLLRRGDTDGLKNFFKQAPDITVGTIAGTSLRQAKNILIAAATTATRAAIEGGLAPVEAYNLSDIYILQAENMTVIDKIYQLQYTMLFDFTQRVAERKLPQAASELVFYCTQYIASKVNEPLTVQSVADHVKISRPYLSKIFSKELGFSVSDFIMRCKLEEARNLLKNTEKTIGEISSYLYFSSQSYFQNVFRKKYGVTPGIYRKKRDS